MDNLVVFLNKIIDFLRRIAPYVGRALSCVGRAIAALAGFLVRLLKPLALLLLRALAALASALARAGAAISRAAVKNPVVLAAVAAAAILAVVIALVFNSCSPVSTTQGTDAGSDVQVPAVISVYDWSRAQKDPETGRYSFTGDAGQSLASTGVDVSDHQGDIDWEKVKADGVDYAIVRAGYRGTTAGDVKADTRCLDNLNGARAAGLKVGVYFFSQATTTAEAVEEVDFIAAQIGDVQLDYPVVYDAEVSSDQGEEGRTKNMGVSELTECCKAFCDAVRAHGWQPMIYGSRADLGRLNLNGDLAEVPVWYAKYDEGWPDVQYNMTMWQYSAKADVDGISSETDINIDLSNVPRNK